MNRRRAIFQLPKKSTILPVVESWALRRITWLVRALLALAVGLGASVHAQTTYRDVSLDCGGWVSGYATHSSGRIYGYGDIFGVYRSDDFGANWDFLQAGISENATTIVGLDVSPQDVNRVAFESYGSVWTSIDGGESWSKRLSDLRGIVHFRGSRPVVYHPTAADELWVAATRSGQSGSLWRSTDHGLTWAAIGGGSFVNERVTTIHFFPSAPNEVWVGTAPVVGQSTLGGLWCSADAGATWTKVWNNGGQQTEYYGAPQVNSIARNTSRVSCFATNDGVWQVTAANWNNPASYSAVQRTWDGQSIPNVTALANGSFWASEMGDQTWAPKLSLDGVTWTDRQISLADSYVPEWTTAAQITSSNRVYGRDILVQDPLNSTRWLLTGGSSAHLSEDNGLTWHYQPGGMAGVASHRINFDRVNPLRGYIAASDHGIFVVNDGGLSGRTVGNSNKNFGELHTYHEAMVSADGQMIVGAGVHQGLNQTVLIRSSDGGVSWTKLAPTGLPASYEGVTRSVMSLNDPNDFLVLLGSTDKIGQANNPGLYRTTNGGASFAKVGGTSFDGIDTGMRYHMENAFLERDGVNANTRYLAVRAENKPAARGVWRSSDGGTTWTLRSDPFGGGWIWAFAVDPMSEGRLWAGGASLRRSDNGGGSWTTISNFVEITALDAYGGRLAVRGRRAGDTFQKIYSSGDEGDTWQELTGASNQLAWAGRSISVDPWRSGQVWVPGSRSIQIINPPPDLDPLLVGTASGSAPYAGDSNFSAGRAYDQETTTFFAPAADGGHTALDLGAGLAARVTAVRYFPRAGYEWRMNGGRFEGSTDGSAWTTLASVSSAPSAGWQTLSVSHSGYFRHLRYLHPTGLADVAEIEFRGLLASIPVIDNQPLPPISVIFGEAINYQLLATGDPAPAFSISAGSLPAGLSLDTTSGLISGTPTTAGIFTPSFTASNTIGSSSPVAVQIAVSKATQIITFGALVTKNDGDADFTLDATASSGLAVSYVSSDPAVAIISGSSVTVVGGGSTTITASQAGNANYHAAADVARTLAVASPSTALAYEDFGYIDASQLNGESGGTGWNAAWSAQPDRYELRNSGLTYGSLDSSGGCVAKHDNPGFGNGVSRSFAAVTGRVWASVLVNFQQIPSYFEIKLNEAGNADWSAKFGIDNGNLFTQHSGGGALAVTPFVPLVNQTYLLVFSYSSIGASPTMIYVNPEVGASSPVNSLASVSFTGINWGMAPGIGQISTYAANGLFQLDEVRIGSSFAAVTPSAAITPTPEVTADQAASGSVGSTFSYQLIASNSPTGWTLASGTLPSGVTLNTASGLLSGTPSVSGNFTPGFTAINAGGSSPSVAVQLTISAAPTALETFRAAYGLAADGSGDLLAPAGDGVANLLKFAFNMMGFGTSQAITLAVSNGQVLSPGGSAGLPSCGLEIGTGRLATTFIRRKASALPASGIAYAVEFSDSLATDGWSVNPAAAESVTSLDATFERVTVTDSTASSAKRFVRLRVITTP